MSSFGIIGTAGRKDDARRLNKEVYSIMYSEAERNVQEFSKSFGVDTLISGGAAWADHLAVRLFLFGVVPKLTLYLPCEFDGVFIDNGIASFRGENPGRTANHYHKQFSRALGIDTMSELRSAVSAGANFVVSTNFWVRNGQIAKYSDILLAFTFGDKEWLKDGGTSHTMNAYLNKIKRERLFDKSFHFNLNDMILYSPAKVLVPKKD